MHQSHQPLRGRWCNETIVLLQTCAQSHQPIRGVGAIQTLFLLQTRINHVNKYAIDGAMQPLFYSELASITPTVTRLLAQCKRYFTPNIHQSRQPLRGGWCNATIVLLQASIQSCQPIRGSWHNAVCAYMGCCGLSVFSS